MASPYGPAGSAARSPPRCAHSQAVRSPEYIQLCEQSRAEAFEWMVQHAEQMGANAIIAVRYDATDLGNNMTEVLAYGTAAVVEVDR